MGKLASQTKDQTNMGTLASQTKHVFGEPKNMLRKVSIPNKAHSGEPCSHMLIQTAVHKITLHNTHTKYYAYQVRFSFQISGMYAFHLINGSDWQSSMLHKHIDNTHYNTHIMCQIVSKRNLSHMHNMNFLKLL